MAQTKAQFESALSMLISCIKTRRPDINVDRDDRAAIGLQLESIIENYKPDESSWPYTCHAYYYDVYLQARRDEGTITPTDLTRLGLNKMEFSEEREYLAHMMRVSDARVQREGNFKECSECGAIKPLSSFKKSGGSKCHACRSAAYRARKLAKIIEGGEQQ